MRRWSIRARAAGMCSLMLLSAAYVLVAPVAPEPALCLNPDNTRDIVWSFDDPANFTLNGTSIAGGFASLEHLEQSLIETTQEDFNSSLRLENVTTERVPGSIALAGEEAPINRMALQPGNESVDAHIRDADPSANFGSLDWLDMSGNPGNDSRIVMRFDVSAIPGNATIVDAMVWLYLVTGEGNVSSVYLVALNKSFDEDSVSWLENSTGDPWDWAGGDYFPLLFDITWVPNIPGWHKFDVSRLLDLWIDGELENNGIMLICDAGNKTLKQFASSDQTMRPDLRPMMAVNYTLPGVVGLLESEVLGPASNATFTTASWSNSSTSLADDEFDSGNLSSRWFWVGDPSRANGSYDVGVTRPGWLHVEGDGNPFSPLIYSGINILHQNITGDFLATTHVENPDPQNDVGSGMLLFGDKLTYIGIYITGRGASAAIIVMASEGGTPTILALLPWGGLAHAYLGIDKRSDTVFFYAGTEPTSWSFIYTYAPPLPIMDRVTVGPFVSSEVWNVSSVAEYEYFRITPKGLPMSADVRVRVGNSTNLSDPSWEAWGAPMPLNSGSDIQRDGRLLQYQVELRAEHDWYSPRFDSISCLYEMYRSNGTLETEDFAPPGLISWLTFATVEDDWVGQVLYSYSTDHGENWTTPQPGGSYNMTSSGDGIKVRIFIETFDTRFSPTVDSVTVTYEAERYTFFIVTPTSVVAGEPFPVTVEVKDELNNTVTSWVGPILLRAMDSTGTMDATGELSQMFAWITEGGEVTIPNERHFVSETIRINVTSVSTYGMSAPITVLPGPTATVEIEPNATQLMEYSSQEYTSTAYDLYGNIVPGANYSWSAEAAIGTLSTGTGRYTVLSTNEPDQTGNLTATADGVSCSLLISVVPYIYAPEWHGMLPTQVRAEDFGTWTLNITSYVSDAEDSASELRWFVTNETIVDIVDGENETGNMEITFSTIQDMYGRNDLRLWAVDSTGMTNYTWLAVEITPVNDKPTIDHVEPLMVKHDSPYTFDFRYYVHDVDNSYDDLALSVDPANAPYATVAGMFITFDYPAKLNGTDQFVVVAVRDGQQGSSTVVRITVTGNSVPVVVELLPDLTMHQGELREDYFDLDGRFSDDEDATLAYSVKAGHVTVTIQQNNSVSFQAPLDWYGEELVVFAATDSDGARVEDTITVTVQKVNQPPYIAGVPDLKVRYDLWYDFDLLPYLSDSDNAAESLSVTTDDPHITVIGTTISLRYPRDMDGTVTQVTITVSDGELSDSWKTNVTVGSNYPPVLAVALPDHEFLEDVPVAYPITSYLEDMFTDAGEGGANLEYYAFSWIREVTVAATQDTLGNWKVEFESELDYYGTSMMTVRGTDSDGALVERSIVLAVIPVPDPPVLALPETMNVTEGAQMAVDLALYVDDPDPTDTEFTFELMGDGLEHVDVEGSALVCEFPEGYLDKGEDSRLVTIELRVVDSVGLVDTDTMQMEVLKAPTTAGGIGLWVYAVVAGLGGTSAVATVTAWRLRKRPFVIQDMMLIHNDGLLIGRYARGQETGMDENILSGMLTAVLNFVEDSMAGSQDSLKTFGFQKYMVLVHRGKRVYAAVVHDGDAPEDIGEELGAFLGRIESVYRKGIENWSGDLADDFPAVDMLISGFVKEHSKAPRRKRADKAVWSPKEERKGE